MMPTLDRTATRGSSVPSVATRRYGQYCAIAKALDVFGDRWALLIVRELLFGALRYTDLHSRLPGIATDMLAIRLRELEEAGVVARSAEGTKVYELTERGHALRPVLEAIAVWGLEELGTRPRTDPFDPAWLSFPISGLFRPERAHNVNLTVKFILDRKQLFLRVDHGQLTFPSELEQVDVTVQGPPDALAAAVTKPGSKAAQRLRTTGDDQCVALLLYVLGLSDTPPKTNPARAARSRGRS